MALLLTVRNCADYAYLIRAASRPDTVTGPAPPTPIRFLSFLALSHESCLSEPWPHCP